MVLVDRGILDIDQPLEVLMDAIPLGNKADLTPRLLLCHSAGFQDWEPYFRLLPDQETAAAIHGTTAAARGSTAVKDLIRQRLIQAPLQYAPGTDFLYSDLGFMVLEWVVEAVSGAAMHTLLEECLFRPLALRRTFLFRRDQSPRFETDAFAATEACPWRKRVLRGEVHDENAYAMGGYSGHAGLFADIEGVYRIVHAVRDHYLDRRRDILEPATVKAFLTRQDLATGSPWALGWDSPSGDHSAAGEYFSAHSVGHLGFTGTSVWMDLEKDVIVILLTNRIHPTRDNTKIRDFRPRFHNLVMEQLGMARMDGRP
jgi:CubicO group peptidase (beta-lactamase class C family)